MSSADQRLIHLMEKLPVQTEVLNLRELFFANETLEVDFFLAKKDEFPYWFFLINHSSRGVLTIQKRSIAISCVVYVGVAVTRTVI